MVRNDWFEMIDWNEMMGWNGRKRNARKRESSVVKTPRPRRLCRKRCKSAEGGRRTVEEVQAGQKAMQFGLKGRKERVHRAPGVEAST